jgi:hypothetical protein
MSNKGMAEKAIANLKDFIERVVEPRDPDGKVVVYRGHADDLYTLKPAVFRTDVRIEREHLLIRDLIAAHPGEFAQDMSALEQLVRMQHFELPTRLLDVSWNPLVALYFAAEIRTKKVPVTRNGRPGTRTVETDGEVIKLTIDDELVRHFDSDVVSCLASIARCSYAQKTELEVLAPLGVEFDKAHREKFNNETTVRRLLHFIRAEKPAFEPEIVPEHLWKTYLVKPKQNNRRILAQEGAFIILGLLKELAETGMPGIAIERMKIGASHKTEIMRQLGRIAINQRTMFPDIDRAARYLTDSLPTNALLGRGASSSV